MTIKAMTFNDFKSLEKSEKVEYIQSLRRMFNVPNSYIAKMLGIGDNAFTEQMKKIGITSPRRNGREIWDKLGFDAFCCIGSSTKAQELGIKIGREVRFTPGWKEERNSRPDILDGKIIYINELGRYFTAEYEMGGETLRESFKYSQVGYGREVHLRGD